MELIFSDVQVMFNKWVTRTHQKALLVLSANFCSVNTPIMVDLTLLAEYCGTYSWEATRKVSSPEWCKLATHHCYKNITVPGRRGKPYLYLLFLSLLFLIMERILASERTKFKFQPTTSYLILFSFFLFFLVGKA